MVKNRPRKKPRIHEWMASYSFTLAPDLLSKSCVRCSAGVHEKFMGWGKLQSAGRMSNMRWLNF